jgi:cytochrome c
MKMVMTAVVNVRVSPGVRLWGLSILMATAVAIAPVASLAAAVSAPQTLSLASSGERPLNPWVFRSVLDGQPRIVTVALHKDLYIAFDASHAGIYKAWKGGVEFDGAVYTTSHGPQPTSEGYAYYEHKITTPVWVVEQAGKSIPVDVKFRGYRFAQEQVIFQYDLLLTDGRAIRVNETPEYRSKNHQAGLQRIFTLAGVPADIKVGLQTAFTSLQSDKDFATDGQFIEAKRATVNHGNGSTLSVEGLLWLNADKATQMSVFFHPGFAGLTEQGSVSGNQSLDDIARGKQFIAASDCHACHNEERKTIGPAYIDIANSYDKSATTRAKLATKVISGGSGVWGEIPMNPHPDLMPADADLMIRYILSLKAEAAEPAVADSLFLGVASQSLQIDDKPKATGETEKRLKPGLAVAVYHIEDFVTQTFSQVVYSGETPLVHVHELKDLGPITTNLRVIFSGYLQVEKAGTYTLRLITDDGGRMSVNGEQVIDRWQNQGPTPVDVKVTLTEGLNNLDIDYFQALAGGSISLQWIAPGAKEFSVIPTQNLRHHQYQIAQPVPYIPRKELVKSIPGDKTPLESVHPSFTLSSARPDWFKPMVGGMDFFSDGRLALCTWDAEGSVYILEGVHDRAPNDIQVKRVASGLGECLGLNVVDEQIFVLQKHELTQLIDTNGDGAIDEYSTVSDQWRVSANFHEFAFGLGYDDGYFYAALATAIEPGGASTNPQIPDRGKVIKISRNDGSVEFIAHGLRTPNGIGKGVDGEYFIADNQGDWLPSSKIVHVKPGAFYGSRSVDFAGTEGVAETPPVVWLPQDEIGNSPSEPIYINVGDYRGQMLHGEVTHGGLKRVYAEKVNDTYQGAVFRFTQGLEAGVNRVTWAPDGKSLFVGGVGNPGNWSHTGKSWFGLERLEFNGKQAFEMLKVSARTNGMELEFTQPLEPGRGITSQEYQVQQWYYLPTAEYGGDKLDLRDLNIRSVNLSKDRKKVFLELDGMKAGHVIYVRIAEPFVSTTNQSLWTTEAWYTLNAIPAKKPGFKRLVKPQPHNTLSAVERKQGWKLLFDGKTTKGWRGYQATETGSAWKVVNGTLHLDPAEKNDWQTVGGGDIITDKIYESYELTIEWKVAPGGNSGLIYGVVEKPEYEYVWHTGTEYQFLDNPAHPDGAIKMHRAGDLYDLISSSFVAVNAGGEWNRTRLVVNKGRVEHWLNGYKVVEYDQRLPAWQRMIANSKFNAMPGFGQSRKGHIALQDHGDPVWFRNIRIREL